VRSLYGRTSTSNHEAHEGHEASPFWTFFVFVVSFVVPAGAWRVAE
jgi:hypothetical protein